VDTLRLAADEGDRSRQVLCKWSILSENGRPIKASNGVVIQPHDGLIDFGSFDYVIVVGGTLHGAENETEAQRAYLKDTAKAGIPLVGLCNGVFTLARAGLMGGCQESGAPLHRGNGSSVGERHLREQRAAGISLSKLKMTIPHLANYPGMTDLPADTTLA
tara:strand:- start:741 stop:1223 length:483 start_codon:yes stop_codon:yes gene_type:complete